MLRGTAGLASSTKDIGRQQHSLLSLHFSTALCVTPNWKSDRSICKTQLCGHLFATRPPTWPRNYLLLVQRPGRQPFSKRHTHRPGLPAPRTFSPSLYFLLLLSAMDSATSSARGFMQAITLLSLLLHRNLAEHTLTLLFTYYIIYCHVSRKAKYLTFIIFVAVCFTSPREHVTVFFFSFRECSIAKKTADQANPSVGRLSTEMKRKMQACRVTLGYSRL